MTTTQPDQTENIEHPETKKSRVAFLRSQPISEYGFKQYKKSLRTHIMTSRFTTQTYNRNKYYRTYPTIAAKNIACIYGTENEIQCIPKGKLMYVLEMNNTINKIMGIGKAYNIPMHKEYCIYKPNTATTVNTQNYYRDFNCVSYTGSERVDCSDMDKDDQEIIEILEEICFKGRGHLKRSTQITQFPLRILYQLYPEINVHEIIEKMFQKYKTKPTS